MLFDDLRTRVHEWLALPKEQASPAFAKLASCLIYDQRNNPLMLPWSSDKGGGPPYLAETPGSIFKGSWRTVNITFAERFLTSAMLCHFLIRSPVPKRLEQDLVADPDGARQRIMLLFDTLRTPIENRPW